MGPLAERWGEDELTRFIETANDNTVSAHRIIPIFRLLTETDATYRTLTNPFMNTRGELEALFLFQTHSCLLAAIRLGTSGQITPAYIVLRGCLENAMYGFYVYRVPGAVPTWLYSSNDESSKRAMIEKFKVKSILQLLGTTNQRLRMATQELYGQTTELGAHPNPLSILSNISFDDMSETVRADSLYLNNKSSAFSECLRTTAKVGLCTLSIFTIVYPKTCEVLNITERIDQLSRDLESVGDFSFA